MQPRRIKELAEEFAELQGLPEQDVADAVNHMYRFLRIKMEQLHCTNLRLAGLGDMEIMPGKVKEAEIANKRMLAVEYLPMYIREKLNEKMKYITAVKEIIRKQNSDHLRRKIQALKGEHIPSTTEYTNGCRCEGCVAIKRNHINTVGRKKARYRYLEKLYELPNDNTKRKTAKTLGEQNSDS